MLASSWLLRAINGAANRSHACREETDDLICNMLMCYYTYHINSSSWLYILFSSMNCIINERMLQHNYISKITNDIYHVSLVQSPLALGLYRLKSGLL